MDRDEQVIHQIYNAFNARDMQGVFALLTDDVAWANAMEGTHIHGKDAIREPFAPFGLEVRFVPYGDADALAAALKELSVPGGPETVRRTPLWSREWLLAVLLGLLAAEWFVRRWFGLA